MYQAQFYRVRRGKSEDVGGLLALKATSLVAAQDEALGLIPPEAANCVKILADGEILARFGFAL